VASAVEGPTRGFDVIKVVVAYIDQDAFAPIREDLAARGIVSMSVVDAGGVSLERFAAPHFRGSPHTQGLQGKLRLEVVVGAEHVEEVKEVVFQHETRRSFMFVTAVEDAYPENLVKLD
jgi:nitrogen regulatory protein PII